jgi:preprotein translocase subunit SecD
MKKPNVLTLVCLLASISIVLAASDAPLFQVRLVVDAADENSEAMTLVAHFHGNTRNEVVNVQKTVLIDQTALKSAKLGTDPIGQPVIDITFTDAGAKRFAEVTRQNIHKRLAFIINGKLCQAPKVQTVIPGGKAQISGDFTTEDAADFVNKINHTLAKD